MLLEKKLLHLLHNLSQEESVTIPVGESEITVRVFDLSSKLSLQTPVYHGGNYIPMSVRSSVQKGHTFQSDINTFLTIDENQFKISINYLGLMDSVNKTSFKDLLEEFSIVAEKWREHLDEQDRNDLVHIPVK